MLCCKRVCVGFRFNLSDKLPARMALLGIALAFICLCRDAAAFLPLYRADSDVAARAELIVVGRIKEGSVEYVPVEKKWGERTVNACYPRAQLIINEVAQGKLTEKEIVVWFPHSAMPVVEGKFDWDYGNAAGKRKVRLRGDHCRNSIQFGTLNSSFYPREDIRDLREAHVWFLASHGGLPGMKADQRGWCLDSWEDIQLLGLKNYFVAYRAAEPKQALVAQLPNYPDRADIIHGYVDYLDAVAAGRVADPRERAARLLPWLFRGHLASMDKLGSLELSAAETAENGLIAAGDPAGQLLSTELAKAKTGDGRRRIIDVLGEMKYAPAVGELVRLLSEDNNVWNNPPRGGFNVLADPENRDRFHESFHEIQFIVQALGKIGDRKAMPAIRETLKRWRDLDNPYLTNECDEALKNIDGGMPKSGAERRATP
jgi:hypothetical protein